MHPPQMIARKSGSTSPAWWPWLLIAASVLGLAVVIPALEDRVRESIDSPAGSVSSARADDASAEDRAVDSPQLPAADPAQLAVFKLQSQMTVGLTALSPGDVLDSLRELDAQAEGVHLVAAAEIVKRFALDNSGGDSGEESSGAPGTLDRRWQQSLASFEGEERAFLEQLGDTLHRGANPEELAHYRANLGWFAELLPVHVDGEKLPPPGRESIRARSMVVAAGSGLLFLAAISAGLVGLILLILYFVQRKSNPGLVRFCPAQDRVREREREQAQEPSPARPPRGILLECFALYLSIMVLGGLLSLATKSPYCSLAALPGAAILGLLWPRFRGCSWRDLRQALGWTRGRGILREAGAGLVGYLGILPIVACGFALTLLLNLASTEFSSRSADPPASENVSDAADATVPGEEETAGPEAEAASSVKRAAQAPITHPIMGWIAEGNLLVILGVLLLASVFAPVSEETFFRGALHRHLRERWSFLPAALLGSFLFAAIHPQGWMAIPALCAMGAGFCLIREWRDSLIAPMTAHAVNNGIIVVLLSLAL